MKYVIGIFFGLSLILVTTGFAAAFSQPESFISNAKITSTGTNIGAVSSILMEGMPEEVKAEQRNIMDARLGDEDIPAAGENSGTAY